MIYYDNLLQLINDIRSVEKNILALFRIANDELCIDILQDVIRQGGGPEMENLEEAPKNFIDFLSDFVVEKTELIEQKIESGKISTYHRFIKYIAQAYWANELASKPLEKHRILHLLNDDPSLLDSIRHKIGQATKEEDIPILLNSSLQTLSEKIEKGKYKGGNIRAFISTTAYNHWRNGTRKRKVEDILVPDDKGLKPSSDYGAYEELIYQDYVRLALKTFKNLSKRCRQVLYVAELRRSNKKQTRAELIEHLRYQSTITLNNKISICKKAWRVAYEGKTK